jgi:hypothetical protein
VQETRSQPLHALALSALVLLAARDPAAAGQGGETRAWGARLEIDPQQSQTPRQQRVEVADIAQPWTIQLEPSLWFGAPGGKVRVPGSPAGTAPVRMELLNLDSPRLSPYSEVHLRSGEWHLSVSGFTVSLEDRGVNFTRTGWLGPFLLRPGDWVQSSIEFTSAEFTMGYRVPIPDTLVGPGGKEFRGTLETIGGLRLYNVWLEFATPYGATSHQDFFPEPIVGLKYTMEIQEKFNIDVQVSIGGFDDGATRRTISWDILSGFSYRPVENVGIQVGYRQLAYNLSSGRGEDRFRYDGAVAGLFGGVVIRF